MMEAEQVSLNWVGHHGSLVSVLQYLMEKERFVDVTLAAEGRCIKLHGLVLCASSPYFEELLGGRAERQATIFLQDVEFEIVKALVEYIYKGVVSVNQHQIMTFLQLAKSLKIKGLGGEDDLIQKEEYESNSAIIVAKPVKLQSTNHVSSFQATLKDREKHPIIKVRRQQEVQSDDGDVTLKIDYTDTAEQCETSLDNCYEEDSCLYIDGVEPDYSCLTKIKVKNVTSLALNDRKRTAEQAGLTSDRDSPGADSGPSTPSSSTNSKESRACQKEKLLGSLTWETNGTLLRMLSSLKTNQRTEAIEFLQQISSLRQGPRSDEEVSELKKKVGHWDGTGQCLCPECGRSFSKKTAINYHFKWECGIVPKYSCDLCPYRAHSSTNVRNHQKAKHALEYSLRHPNK